MWINISDLQKVRATLELEGEICSLDPEIKRVRQQVYLLQKNEYMDIWKEDCDCSEGKQRATLNKSGIPRVHKKYIKDWVL